MPKLKPKYRLAILLSVWMCCGIFAQSPRLVRLEGWVYDAHNRSALPFANIASSNSGQGTFSNYQGRFVLHVPPTSKLKLEISLLGYEKQIVEIQAYTDTVLQVLLPQISYYINDIVISPDYAFQLLQKALGKVNDNMQLSPAIHQAFYREGVVENNYLIDFIEAVIDVYRPGAGQRNADMLHLLKGRRRNDVADSEIWKYLSFVDGPYEMIYSDFAKYPHRFITIPQTRVSFLDPHFSKFYKYSLSRIKGGNSDDMYIVKFEPKTLRNCAVLSGEVYIDCKTLAFVGMYYTIMPEKIEKVQLMNFETFDALSQADIDVRTLDFSCLVHYRFVNGYWQFNSSKISYQMVLHSVGRQLMSVVGLTQEFVVTSRRDTCELKNPFGRNGQIKLKSTLSEQIGAPDEHFWQNYPFITPEEWLEDKKND